MEPLPEAATLPTPWSPESLARGLPQVGSPCQNRYGDERSVASEGGSVFGVGRHAVCEVMGAERVESEFVV